MKYGIIAAGLGSRLNEDGYPGFKPMVKIQGETLIERQIRIFNDNGASQIHIILNAAQMGLGGYIKELPSEAGISIQYKNTESSFHSFYELVHPLEIGSGICISTIDPIYNENSFRNYINSFKQETELDGLMAVTTFIDDDKPLHVEVDSAHFITGFSGTAMPHQPFISGGVYCLRQSAIDLAPRALAEGVQKMRNYQQALVDNHLKIKAYPIGKIIDIDHLADIALADQFLSTQS